MPLPPGPSVAAEGTSQRRVWRNGLTAFLTLVTTGVIIKGRDTTAGVPTAWRVVITVLIGGGLALAVAGLWQVLAAQAGTRYRLSTRQDIRRTYGAVEAYEVAVADEAADKLGAGRRLVVAALISLLAGGGVSWWAPAAPPNHPPISGSPATTPSSAASCARLAAAAVHESDATDPGDPEAPI